MRRLKLFFGAWLLRLSLYGITWVGWSDDRAPAALFLAWSALGIPLYILSRDLVDPRPAPRWLPVLLWWSGSTPPPGPSPRSAASQFPQASWSSWPRPPSPSSRS